MNGPTMTPPKYDKKVGRPSNKRRKSPLEEDDGTRLSRHGIIGHCGVCNVPGHTRRKCPELGRDQPAAPQPDLPAAAQPDQLEPIPIQIVILDDQPDFLSQPPKKMPVKRSTSKVHYCSVLFFRCTNSCSNLCISVNFQKKTLPQMLTSATTSVVEASMSYDITSSSVIQILQDQVSSKSFPFELCLLHRTI